MPRMPFIGVRISWLIVARNVLLARVAARASSRAWRSASAWAASAADCDAISWCVARRWTPWRRLDSSRNAVTINSSDTVMPAPSTAERQQRALVVEERLARQHAQAPAGAGADGDRAARERLRRGMQLRPRREHRHAVLGDLQADVRPRRQDALEELVVRQHAGDDAGERPAMADRHEHDEAAAAGLEGDGRCNHRLAAVARPVERGTTLGRGPDAGADDALVARHRLDPPDDAVRVDPDERPVVAGVREMEGRVGPPLGLGRRSRRLPPSRHPLECVDALGEARRRGVAQQLGLLLDDRAHVHALATERGLPQPEREQQAERAGDERDPARRQRVTGGEPREARQADADQDQAARDRGRHGGGPAHPREPLAQRGEPGEERARRDGDHDGAAQPDEHGADHAERLAVQHEPGAGEQEGEAGAVGRAVDVEPGDRRGDGDEDRRAQDVGGPAGAADRGGEQAEAGQGEPGGRVERRPRPSRHAVERRPARRRTTRRTGRRRWRAPGHPRSGSSDGARAR